MSPSELKYLHECKCPDSNYFSRKTMAFFGDTMRNYGVYRATIAYSDGSEPCEGYVLYRKRPVKHNNNGIKCFTLDGEDTSRKPI